MSENSAWRKAISAQEKEIPALEEILALAVHEQEPIEKTSLGSGNHFIQQLESQQKEMKQINREIGQQQKRLAKDCKNVEAGKYDIHTLCTQDILRERIKSIEKNFIDLKCNFIRYISTLL